MAFVPASRMAEHPKQWWTSKIRGKCAGSGQAKYTDIFNGKCVQCKRWKLVHVGTFQCGKAEQCKSLLHPPLHGVPAKKICYSTREAILLMFFPWADLHNVRAFAKTVSLTLIAATLANAWQEPCTILAIDWRVSREQEPCWRKPGKTRHYPAELNWRKPGTQRNLAAPGGAAEPSGTRNPVEPGGTRQNPAEHGGTWQNPAETWRKPGGTRRKKSKLKGGWLGVKPSGLRQVLIPKFLPSPAVSSASPVTTSHNLSVLFQNSFQLNCQLSTACLRGGGWLSSFALKSRSTQPTCPVHARRWTLETFNRQLGRR